MGPIEILSYPNALEHPLLSAGGTFSARNWKLLSNTDKTPVCNHLAIFRCRFERFKKKWVYNANGILALERLISVVLCAMGLKFGMVMRFHVN